MSTTFKLMVAGLCMAGLWQSPPAYAQQTSGITATPLAVQFMAEKSAEVELKLGDDLGRVGTQT